MRVEALSTPSEHVPELLARVKPLYLARTYGLTLPEAGTWAADDLLDVLARAKGRLLKGGEPDIEGAAKIVLSDWVRGRIPFFVTPPERPAALNEREEKERARAPKAKGGENGEDVRVPGVKQNLGSIMQKNTFVGEDVRPLEAIDLEGESEDGEDDEAASADGEEAEADVETPLAWGDVFAEASQDVLAETASPEREEQGEEEEWSGITSFPGEDEGERNFVSGNLLADAPTSCRRTIGSRIRGYYEEGTPNDNKQGI